MFNQDGTRPGVCQWLKGLVRRHWEDRHFRFCSVLLLLVIVLQEAQEDLDNADQNVNMLIQEPSLALREQRPVVSIPSFSRKDPSSEEVPKAPMLASSQGSASFADFMKFFFVVTLHLVALSLSFKDLRRSWALMLEAQEEDRAQAPGVRSRSF